jgi:hypothetical protein
MGDHATGAFFMNRQELEHAIRAACEVAQDIELWVFGSQAILAEYPDAPPLLRQSIEVDVAPKNHPERVDEIDGALGEMSSFHETFGYYVHGVPIESAKIPSGWMGRAVPVPGRGPATSTGLCLERHDLAASKMTAYREKDLRFVRTLLIEGMIEPDVLLNRVATLPVEESVRAHIALWVRAVLK